MEKILSKTENYVIWDFGGQEQFRTKYLMDFARYVENATRIIFVIDIQDLDRINDAIEYFKNILQSMGEINLNISIDVFLHKYDPSIEMEGDEQVEKAAQDVIEQITAMIPPDLNYRIFKTTIYTVFRQTLVQ